jgi:hypothetical protein
MAKHSMKMGGKEVGPASVYAGRSKEAMPDLKSRTNMGSANTVNMSVGSISRDPEGSPTKTSGIKIRGTGAATKGTMARGPMA